MQDIVSVVDLVKRYGNMIALDHFTMEIERGEIFRITRAKRQRARPPPSTAYSSCLPTIAERFACSDNP